MGEDEYIQLNNLLTKYRVKCLKEYSMDNIDTKYRQKMISQIRSIDNLRKNMILIIDEEVAECLND